ncbi:MAG: hypothetical protein K8R79_10350, partial [Calditrichales bacterium]|nr:hypothetical protein [Calditrichales bacterium]
LSQTVLRIWISKNLNWYNQEKAQTNRQDKDEVKYSNQAAKAERAADGLDPAEENNKNSKAKRTAKHRI